MREKFITFHGSLGVGKTTQAIRLAEALDTGLLLGEETEQAAVQSGEVFPADSGIEVEKWFLDYHVGKLAGFQAVPHNGLVTDMSTENDLVWGRALLEPAERQEFEAYYENVTAGLPTPDLSILLLLPPEVILERIHSRRYIESREFESDTSAEFVDRIQQAFIDNSEVLASSVEVVDLREDPHLSIEQVHNLVISGVSNHLR